MKRNGFTSPVVAVLAIFGPKAGKTGTPNNGICIIIASSISVKVLSCSQLKPSAPIWTLALYKQLERGRFIPRRTIIGPQVPLRERQPGVLYPTQPKIYSPNAASFMPFGLPLLLCCLPLRRPLIKGGGDVQTKLLNCGSDEPLLFS